MLKEINRHAINDLIEYYQDLNNINIRFNDKNPIYNININYSNLIEQLITVREFLINKDFFNINAIYRPTENLFIYKEHYAVLEETVQFFKLNINEHYPIPEANLIEDFSNANASLIDNTGSDLLPSSINLTDDTNIDNVLVQSCNELKNKLVIIEEKLESYFVHSSATHDNHTEDSIHAEILNKISQVNDSINSIINQDFLHSVTKTSQDTLTLMKTNSELVRSDLKKYDELLTSHITKTSANVTEVTEKEYARFVHRVSGDISAIIAGITEANIAELAIQSKLVQTNMDKFDNKIESKFLKWFSIIFFVSAFMLFGNSVLSSSWAANKVESNAKLVKLSMTCKPDKASNPHKAKVRANDDNE